MMSSSYNMKSFALDGEDNTWFGFISLTNNTFTKINRQGDGYITGTVLTPAGYQHNVGGAAEVPRFFHRGNRLFVAAHGRRQAVDEKGILLTELQYDASTISPKTANGFVSGAVFLPTENPAATDPLAETVYAKHVEMDTSGAIHIGGDSYYDDALAGSDAGFYHRYRIQNWDTLAPQLSGANVNDLDGTQFASNFLTPPSSTAETPFGTSVTADFLLGSFDAILQKNGGLLILGTNSSDSFSSLAQATTGRFLPTGGSDSAFRAARAGESDVQVPLVNLTVSGGYNAGFYRGTLASDGKYITAGHFKVSGQKNKVWVARFWP